MNCGKGKSEKENGVGPIKRIDLIMRTPRVLSTVLPKQFPENSFKYVLYKVDTPSELNQ